MGKIKHLLLSFIMIMISSVFVLAGCDEYRKLQVNFVENEVVFYLKDNPEENIFSLSAIVSGNKKGVSSDVIFDIHSTQGIIEQYGEVSKDDTKSTIQYRALSKGTVKVHVTTKEGGKTDVCTVTVKVPVKGLEFTKESLLISRGAKKDFSSFITPIPGNADDLDVELNLVDVDDLDQSGFIYIDGTSVTVDRESTIESFTISATYKSNPEATANIEVNVVDVVNRVTIEQFDVENVEDPYVELEKVDGVYNLNLAQNVGNANMFKKLFKVRGYIINGEEMTSAGYLGNGSDYTIRFLKLNESTGVYSQISLPYTSEHMEISQQLSNGAFQVLQRSKGSEKFKLVIDYADHDGEFTQEINLNINIQGLPTKINLKSSGEEFEELVIFRQVVNEETGITIGTGTSLELEVLGVNQEVLSEEPILISLTTESGLETKVRIKNKYGDYIEDFENPITMAKDAPLSISHYYESIEAIPTDLVMTFTSMNYDKVFTSFPLVINTSEVAEISIPDKIMVSIEDVGKQVNITYLDANREETNFDTSLLNVHIGNTNVIELDETKFAEGKVVLIPKTLGRSTFSVATPHNIQSRTITVIVFEELKSENTTIRLFDTVLVPTSISPTEKTIVLKTFSTYPLRYNINDKYNYILSDMEVRVTSTSSIISISEGSIITSRSVGLADLTITMKGYSADGKLNKLLTFKCVLDVRAPLISATPSKYVETIYDRQRVLNYENTLARRTIKFTVSPTNASYTAEDMSWVVKIGSIVIEPMTTQTSTVGNTEYLTYVFSYNNNLIYIETNPDDLKSATVYASLMTDTSLVFNVICQIKQTFTNEQGVATTSVNDDVDVTFTVLQPTKVTGIILNNVKKTSVTLPDNSVVTKNSYTFDTRDMTINEKGLFVSGNEYIISYDIIPANATIQELTATHSQAASDLQVTIDNVKKQIKIRVNRQLDGETIIYIRSNDSEQSNVIEQQIYLKVANGSYKNPFEIANADDMLKISSSLNSHYILTSDINLDSISSFEPIGTAEFPFTGTLDGRNRIVLGEDVVYVQHTIQNLNINRTQSDKSENYKYLGLFGYVGETGAVVNVHLKSINISVVDSHNSCDVYLGAIAGFSKGLILNCSVSDDSTVATAKAAYMFESEKNVGIYYRTLGSQKYTYIGGVVGMLLGTSDLGAAFHDRPDLIEGINSNFVNNKAFVNIVSSSTIPTGANIVGGLVGYNLGAKITTNEKSDYHTIAAINTLSTVLNSNINSVFGGLVGTNIGTIENYTVKSYINGITYVGGLAGINLGKVLNNTVIPTIRGVKHVGGLVSYNIYSNLVNQDDISYEFFPRMYEKDVLIDDFRVTKADFLKDIHDFDFENQKVKVKAVSLLRGNKVQFLDMANIHESLNKKYNGKYNTAIIGQENVGGLIGSSYDYVSNLQTHQSKINYNMPEYIIENSVYSYYVVGSTHTFSNGDVVNRIIYAYIESQDEANYKYNRYYGDIISTGTSSNIGGLIGYANHANIIKGFVNANIVSTAGNTTQNIGGIIGKVGASEAILRIKDSHTNGIISSQNEILTGPGANNIGAFVGDASTLHIKQANRLASSYYNGNTVNFYNVESSYSVMRQSKNTKTFVNMAQLSWVNGFSGSDTTKTIDNLTVLNSNFDGVYSYDNLTAANAFYIGFEIRYLQKVVTVDIGGTPTTVNTIDMDTAANTSNYENIVTMMFTYEDAVKGYHEFDDGSKLYYFNHEFKNGNTIQYCNFKVSDNYIMETETVDGVLTATALTWNNTILTSVDSNNVFKTYYIENDDVNENGFGNTSETVEVDGEDVLVINSKYNWYHNVYEYINPLNNAEKYKAYSGLPLPLALTSDIVVPTTPVIHYATALTFVADLPPMGIGVELKEDRIRTFIHAVDGSKEVVLFISELDTKYYNSDGTINAFNAYELSDRQSYSQEIKTNIAKENTYKISDVIDITALPKFVNADKLDYRSVYGLLTFGYDANGNATMQVISAGYDEIEITSLYNTEISYVVKVNILSKVSGIEILQNKRDAVGISSIDVVKNVETSIFAKINSELVRTISSRTYEFDLIQRQDVGVRYYFTNRITRDSKTILSLYTDVAMGNSVAQSYTLNGQQAVEEEVQVLIDGNIETRYVRYVDISSSEVSILGAEDFSQYSTIMAVPYVEVNDDYFFPTRVEDVEEIANSYVEGASGVPATFTKSSNLISPLQIRIYNDTFGLRMDKRSLEFSAYTEPVLSVTLDTDNFDEELFYVISNGNTDTGESSADDESASRTTVLGNLTVVSYLPDCSATAIANREKTYQFKFSVSKTNGMYNTIVNDEIMTISFYTKDSDGNVEFVRTCNITLLPQPVTNTAVLHYPSSEYEEVVENGTTVFIPKANEVAYNNIIPGYMGLLKINLSPYYSNIEYVVIESESSMGDGKFITLEQLVYSENEETGEFSYKTAYPQAQTTKTGIIALKRSNDVNGVYLYDGNIYLRTILPSSIVSGTIFTVTVTAYAYANGDLVSYEPATLQLEAICPPGLHVRYKNSSFGIVARGTDNIINVTGDSLEGAYIDFDKYTTLSIYNGSTEYGVGGKVRIEKLNETEYKLSLSTDIPQGSTITLVGYTERIINDKLYTSRSELKLKVADFVVESITVDNVYDGIFQATLNQTRLLRVAVKDVSYNANIPGIARKITQFIDQISTKLNSRNENATWYQRVYNLDGSFTDISLSDNDYGTFVIDVKDDGKMYIRNTVKTSTDVLVAKAIINYSFGTNSSIGLEDPNAETRPNGYVDESYIVELECEFSFNVQRNTEDETPEPISTAEQFVGMEAGINYILTNDIVLTDYTPINTEIASLDGNGFVITIKNFDTSVELDEQGNPTTDTTNIQLGLFSTVSEITILKNLVLEIVPLSAPYVVEESSNNSTQDMLIDVTSYDNVTFGFIAAENKGTITNAQVVNDRLANEIRRERERMLDNYYSDEEYTPKTYTDVADRSISVVKILAKEDVVSANVGGLVATNNGYITNSRVENITINGIGYVGGIAVRNNGTISSTYYKGANLLNQSSELIETAGTAGLVVFNSEGATIQYCYTMSREGWSYTYAESGDDAPDEENNKSNGKITYYDIDTNIDTTDLTFNIGASTGDDYLAHRDITGIEPSQKNLFTGVYNINTLEISNGVSIIDNKTNSEIYKLAMIALLDTTDIMTLRAVNSGINVDTDASGFVYENSGTISNSYANMLVNAAHSAGFVFTSTEEGLIEDCYSLSSVGINSDAHSPFTGKTIENTESKYNATTSNISYSHYLDISQSVKFVDESSTPYTIELKDKFYDANEPATSLEAQELYSYNSFQGYAFNSDFELNVDILRSVWFIPGRINDSSYETYQVLKNNFKHGYYAPNRPELISANIRSMSVRVLLSDYETSSMLQYEYLPELIYGESIRNPYLVYNAKTFNDYGTMSARTSSGDVNNSYIRFISDITFDGTSVHSMKAETYNTAFAGDIDGNGMTINELKLIAESNLESLEEVEHLGLFGKLYSFSDDANNKYTAIVRNLNINITSIDGTGVMYVGALAGEMIDSYAFNIKILGEGIYVNGQNAVGGAVGKISGNSELVNVQTNISVSATNKSTMTGKTFKAYDRTKETLQGISYAGGIAGIVDVNGRDNDVKTAQKYARIRKLDVYGSTTISGDISGGIFGYVGNNSSVSDVHFTITNNGEAAPRIISKYSAGGIVGELRGKIERSYIAHSNQSEINAQLKTNINKTTHNTSTDMNYLGLFNGSALSESYYLGGIAGMNIGGSITDSYSNVDVINGISQFAGGVVGMNAGGNIKSVYTTGTVYAKYVGGFIGLAVNGGLLEVGLADNSYSKTALKENGMIIDNMDDLVANQVELSSLIINSIVSANVWREEDLAKVNYDNLGSFIGKIIDMEDYNSDPEGIEPALISTTSNNSRQMAEVNIFANATKTVNGRVIEIKEIGAANIDCTYEVNEYEYNTDVGNEPEKKYQNGRYGVAYKSESNKYYYYSRMKTYGSLRTLEEIINRNTSGTISKAYETSMPATSAGLFDKYKVQNGHILPKIYKGWSAIYWEGTSVNNLGEADSEQTLPSLIARPNVAVVRVYDVEDLKLMSTLLGSEFVLMNDIDLEGEAWTPVGTESDPFTGSIHSDFDSNNEYNSWTIKNVSISSSDGDSVGLLGAISGATLNNFNLHIQEIEIEESTQYELYVGGLVGHAKEDNPSTISDITVFGGKEVVSAGAYTGVDTIDSIGTSELKYQGTSNIVATNVFTMGGVVGYAKNSFISDLHAVNLHIYSQNIYVDGNLTTEAGAKKGMQTFSAIGGVVGYMENDQMYTMSNMTSKNVYIGNDHTDAYPIYSQTLYMGGVIGRGGLAYMRNAMATNFVINETLIKTVDQKAVFVGGIAGSFEGTVFNAVVRNDPDKETIGMTIGGGPAITEVDNGINLEVKQSSSNSNTYIGGAFGRLTKYSTIYNDVPTYYGTKAVRPDSNPFGAVASNNVGEATGKYEVKNISNAIVVESNINVKISFAQESSYIGGVIGNSNSPLYNLVSYGDLNVELCNDAYIGGLIGHASNDYIQNAYNGRNITITDISVSENSKSLHVGGAIGYANSLGNFSSVTSNKQSQNIVANGVLEITKTNYKTSYIGGLIGKSYNIALNASISNTDIIVGSLQAKTRADLVLSYIGGFVGYFEQAAGSGVKPTFIMNSYSTGAILLGTNSHMLGGAGGFVGYITTSTNNKQIYDGNSEISKDSANIKNCYTISRIIPYDDETCTISEQTKQDILLDNLTKGGFVGAISGTGDILTACYFNKEIFSSYENSANELAIKRYVPDPTNPSETVVVTRNFGTGLTLDQMLYSVSGSDMASTFTDNVLDLTNTVVKDPTDPSMATDMERWYIEDGAYPLLQFYFESWKDVTFTEEDTETEIPWIVHYNYVNPVFEDIENKYDISQLLNGRNVISGFIVEDITGTDDDGNEIVVGYNVTESIAYAGTNIKALNNVYGVQSVGNESNPWVISSATVDLESTTDGELNYDFTNKSVVFTDNVTNVIGSYQPEDLTTVNSTILFNMAVASTMEGFFTYVDRLSFMYGLVLDLQDEIIVDTNYGELKNFNIDTLQDELFIENYGLINNIVVGSFESDQFVVDINKGTIDTVYVCVESEDYSFVNENYGYINAVRVDITNESTEYFDSGAYRITSIIGADTLVTNYMLSVKLSDVADLHTNVGYIYQGYTADSLYIYTTHLSDGTENMFVYDDNRTYLQFTSEGMVNNRAHAIDVFGYTGYGLLENKAGSYDIKYDFGRDWIIITGLNNNMPILRNTLKDNHYDKDISSDYYFDVDAPAGITSFINVSTPEKLAAVTDFVKTGTGTVTINIENDIDLAGKIWKPIISESYNLKIVVEGNGHTISNISVLTRNSDAGLFGRVLGGLEVNNLLMKDGYVANVTAYTVGSDPTQNTSFNSPILTHRDLDLALNQQESYQTNRNHSVGAIAGRTYISDSSTLALLLDHVGNQYVYVSGYTYNNTTNTQFNHVAGLVGMSLEGSVIVDSYVNCPFMYQSGHGAHMLAGGTKYYLDNTYVVNYDVDVTTPTMRDTYYYLNTSALPKGYSGQITYSAVTYKSTVHNYYYAKQNSLNNVDYRTGISLTSLRSDILPTFNWVESWARVQELNDGLPFHMPDNDYWITVGQNAVSGTDYRQIDTNYEIKTEIGLAWLAYQVQAGNTFEGATIELVAGTTYNMKNKAWTPIGYYQGDSHTENRVFKGTFDGKNCTITNISATEYFKVDGSIVSGKSMNYSIGLFGYTNGATIKNVNIAHSKFSGNSYIGAIVGYAEDTYIDSCTTDAETFVTGDSIVGGIIGYIESTNGVVGSRLTGVSSRNTNNATVSGRNKVGGIVGYTMYATTQMSTNNGLIYTYAYNSAAVSEIGGIVGSSYYGSVYEVINKGNIYAYDAALSNGAKYVGGIIGYFTTSSADKAQLINALNDANIYVDNKDNNGLLVGYTLYTSNIIMAYATAESTKYVTNSISTEKAFIGTTSDANGEYYGLTTILAADSTMLLENSVWSIVDGVLTLDYEVPSAFAEAYTPYNEFEVTKDLHLQYLNYFIHKRANYSYESTRNYLNVTVNSSKQYSAENEYTDSSNKYVFSGKLASTNTTAATINIAVSDVSSNYHGGLFGVIKNATIENITLATSNAEYGAGRHYVGFLAGYAEDSVIDSVSITGSGTLSGLDYVGGVIAYAVDCQFIGGNVAGITIKGTNYVGGFVGRANNTSIVGEQDQDLSSATIKGSLYAGGIVGYANDESSVKLMRYSGTIANTGTARYYGGIVGYTTNSTIDSCKMLGSITGINTEAGGITGLIVDSTVIGSEVTSTAVIEGKEYIGGIVGKDNGGTNTVENNTFNGKLYIYQVTDASDGKKSATLSNFGITYSITYDSSKGCQYSYSIGDPILEGNLNVMTYTAGVNCRYIVGNSASHVSNVVGTSAQIELQDTYVEYTMSFTSTPNAYIDESGLFGFSKTAVVKGIVQITGKMYSTRIADYQGNESHGDHVKDKSISNEGQGTEDAGWWSTPAYGPVAEKFISDIASKTYNFDVTW